MQHFTFITKKNSWKVGTLLSDLSNIKLVQELPVKSIIWLLINVLITLVSTKSI